MSGIMGSAPPLPWYCQTPERSRFGAGADAGLGAAGDGVAWALAMAERANGDSAVVNKYVSR